MAGSHSVNILYSLTDKFSKPMQNITDKSKEAEKELRRANNQLKRFGKGVQNKLSGIASGIGQIAGAMGAISAGAFVMDGIDTFVQFDEAMHSLAATAGITASETNADYKSMMDMARKLGRETSKTAKEAANAMEYMVLAGWDTKTVMAQVGNILKFSEATGMDLARASDLITDSLSALGLDAKDTAHYLDVVAKAQSSANYKAEDLLTSYKAVGGMMANLKIPIEESATALGVMANRGIKAAEGGNALSAVMINLTSNQGKAAKALEAIGVSAFQNGKFIGLKNLFVKLDKATKNLTEEQKNMYLAMIGGKEHISDLNALMAGLNAKTKDGSTEWDSLRNKLDKAGGALDAMRKTKMDTLKGSMDRFKSAMEDAQISLVSGFAPALSKMLDSASSDTLPKLSATLENFGKNTLPAMIDALDTLSPLLAGTLGYFMAFSIISKVAAAWNLLVAAYEIATAAQWSLNAAMSANPIGAVAAAIGILITVVTLLWKNWDKVVEKVKAAWEWMGKVKDIKIFGGGSAPAPDAPKHATGTSYFAGGQTYVGEGGRGELITLPSGSQIIPHDSIPSNSNNITVNLTIQGNMIGNDEFINQCGQAITQKLQVALGNI